MYWTNVRVEKLVLDQISALGSVADDGVSGHIDDGGVLRVVLARSDGTRGVGVGVLKLSLRSFPVLESLVLPIAIASVVGSGVRDELLLGEGEEVEWDQYTQGFLKNYGALQSQFFIEKLRSLRSQFFIYGGVSVF